MDVFVTKLRKYLNDDPNIEIKNIHGSGFFLEVKPVAKDTTGIIE
jgi:DNA-binding response OmpR family regulator